MKENDGKSTIILILPLEIAVNDKKSALRNYEKPLGTDLPVYQFQQNYETLREPLGIESIAAFLRENGFLVEMVFFDLERPNEQVLINEMKRKNVLFVGFSVLFDLHLLHALQFSSLVKRQTQLPIFFGGALASFISEDLLYHISWIDSVIVGEGEQVCLQLAQALQQREDIRKIPGLCCRDVNGKPTLSSKATKVDLCKLPPPVRDYHITAQKKNISISQAAIYTSRGCPEKCVFCTGNTFTSLTTGKAWRFRNALDVVDEIEQLISSLSIKYFYICDDNFIGYGEDAIKRIGDIVDELAKRCIKTRFHCECRVDVVNDSLLSVLKKGGFVDILLGIEAGVDSMLHRWGKSTTVAQNREAIQCVRKNGLNLKPGFILFDQYTTLEELEENLQFIQTMKLNTPEYVFDLFNPMQCFHGSRWDNVSHKSKYSNTVNINNSDSIYEYATYLCDKNYEADNEKVRMFWKTISPILEELGKYMNLEIPKALYEKKNRSARSAEILSYINKYSRWRKDIGDVLIEMSLLTVESMKNFQTSRNIERDMYRWYRNKESSYFEKSMLADFHSLLTIKGDS